MAELIETIPNFSEGRNTETMRKIAEAFTSEPTVKLLDYSGDVDHNRSVYTAVGQGDHIVNALIKAAKVAVENIDLNTHSGLHPRVGAMDVVPFVPIRDADIGRALQLSADFARRLWKELAVPSYFYEDSQPLAYRKNLAEVRRGEFEGLAEKMMLPEWHPDTGDFAPHKTAGVTVTGGRKPLIAYNIYLNTDDVTVAKKIASAIREANGGLPRVKALGLFVREKGLAQVSMNLTDYTVTSPGKVFDRVAALATESGTGIFSSELIGLAPEAAFADASPEYLKIENFTENKIIERNL